MTDTKKTAPTDEYYTPQGVFPGKPHIEYPKTPGFEPKEPCPVGGVILAPGTLNYNVDRVTRKIAVKNTGDRPVQVGSHMHFFEVNRYMQFDRGKAFGFHLNIPATTAIRFEPGEEKEIEIVQYSGKRRAIGFNDLVNGYTGLEDLPTYYPKKIRAFKRVLEYGFGDVHEEVADEDLAAYEKAQKAKKSTTK